MYVNLSIDMDRNKHKKPWNYYGFHVHFYSFSRNIDVRASII